MNFGTCKIKDGLYIGAEQSANDFEFIVVNKVCFIINTCGDQVSNLWEEYEIQYFTFNWNDGDAKMILKNDLITQMYEFIEEAFKLGQSCLIHSYDNQSQVCSLVSVYLMKKFNWSLYKTLQFLNSRRTDLEIQTTYFDFLTQYEQQLKLHSNLSTTWEIQPNISTDELILTNTYLNAIKNQVDTIYTSAQHYTNIMKKNYDSQIKWATIISYEVNESKEKKPLQHIYKSIIKGSDKVYMKQKEQQRPTHHQQSNSDQIDKYNQERIVHTATFSLHQNEEPSLIQIDSQKQKVQQNCMAKENEQQRPPQIPKYILKGKENIKNHNSNNSYQLTKQNTNLDYEQQIARLKNMIKQNDLHKTNSTEIKKKPIINQQQVKKSQVQRSISNPKAQKQQTLKNNLSNNMSQQQPQIQYKSMNKKKTNEKELNKSMNQLAQPTVIIKPKMPDFNEWNNSDQDNIRRIKKQR